MKRLCEMFEVFKSMDGLARLHLLSLILDLCNYRQTTWQKVHRHLTITSICVSKGNLIATANKYIKIMCIQH